MIDREKVLSNLNFRNFYTQYIPTLKINGKAEALGLCPFHDDKNPSLSVNIEKGLYNCLAGCGGGDVFHFYQRLKGVDFPTALKELAEMQGVSETPKGKAVARFEYKDLAGKILYIKERIEPGRDGRSKDFIFKHFDGNKWVLGRGCESIPYNLPLLSKSKYVFIVEGEAKADLLINQFNLTATCLDSGAQSPFKDSYLKYFEGKEKIIILLDNDTPGRQYADKVASALHDKVKALKIVDLPGLQEAGDIIDWVAARDSKETEAIKTELFDLVKAAPVWTPKSQDTQTGMTLIKIGDLLKEPEELISWTVDNMLPSGGFSVLASKPKTGKSTIARNLALSVAQGKPFLGKTVSKGSVIYYALEEKKAEVKRHFQDMGATGNEEIYIYTGGTPVDAIQQIKKVAETIKPVLIIIDPLFRLAKVKDGNDYVQVTQALDPLLRLARDTGCHVLCAHHTNKGQAQGGDSVLGSTAIFSSVDTLLIMKRHEEYRTILTIQRYGDDLPETTLHFDKTSRVIEIGKPKAEEDIDSLKTAIMDFLSSQSEPVVKSVIMEGVEGRQAIKHKALMELVKNEQVAKEGSGGKGDPYKYGITLLPNISWVIPKQNPENCENPCQQRANSITQKNAEILESEKSRVIPFSPQKDTTKGKEDVKRSV